MLLFKLKCLDNVSKAGFAVSDNCAPCLSLSLSQFQMVLFSPAVSATSALMKANGQITALLLLSIFCSSSLSLVSDLRLVILSYLTFAKFAC